MEPPCRCPIIVCNNSLFKKMWVWMKSSGLSLVLDVLSTAAPYCAIVQPVIMSSSGATVRKTNGSSGNGWDLFGVIFLLHALITAHCTIDCCQSSDCPIQASESLSWTAHGYKYTCTMWLLITSISITIQIWLHWPNMNFLHSDISAYTHSSLIQMNLGVWSRMVKIGN